MILQKITTSKRQELKTSLKKSPLSRMRKNRSLTEGEKTTKRNLTEDERKNIFEMHQTGQYLNSTIAQKYNLRTKSIHLIVRAYRKKMEAEQTQ